MLWKLSMEKMEFYSKPYVFSWNIWKLKQPSFISSELLSQDLSCSTAAPLTLMWLKNCLPFLTKKAVCSWMLLYLEVYFLVIQWNCRFPTFFCPGYLGAVAGTLTFMVGCEAKEFEKAKEFLVGMGKNIVHCGGVGSGLAAKLCNNMLLGITMAGTAEALNLGIR